MTRNCQALAANPDDRGSLAAMLIDRDRRRIEASDAAQSLLDDADVIRNSFGRLGAANQCDDARIERALVEAQRDGGSSARIAGGGATADVARLGGTAARPHFLIIVQTAHGICEARAERAAGRFGLTPAENRLLKCLAGGLDLKQSAIRLGVGRTTARTHLQKIFDKTGVRRQTELQRIIGMTS